MLCLSRESVRVSSSDMHRYHDSKGSFMSRTLICAETFCETNPRGADLKVEIACNSNYNNQSDQHKPFYIDLYVFVDIIAN